MPKFQYTARTAQNEEIEGTLEAESEAAAADSLLERELIVTNVSEMGGFSLTLFVKAFFNRVSKKDLAIFFAPVSNSDFCGDPSRTGVAHSF